jgi:selenide,water dikinase
MSDSADGIKLTQYSHGAGCGCKISPQVLGQILHFNTPSPSFPTLLVGNETRDDAAVLDMGNGEALISTTDFFMPIVDDAFEFGYIAATNAISDIYAMGGTPLMAIAILGFPVDKLPASIARDITQGGRKACFDADIPLAGGHSIDNPKPVFGLAVTGKVRIEYLKQNSTATPGCSLYLTKPLGVGILSTAQKKGLLKAEHARLAPDNMIQLNKIGSLLGTLSYVKALTDVTGFGLLGHLLEMCEGSRLKATLYFDKVPLLPFLEEYLSQKAIPGGTKRNWDSYGHKIAPLNDLQQYLLADPQTSGGLLVAVEAGREKDMEKVFADNHLSLQAIGYLEANKEQAYTITVH